MKQQWATLKQKEHHGKCELKKDTSENDNHETVKSENDQFE